MIVQYPIVLSVLCQLPPDVRDVHERPRSGVDGVELDHGVWVALVDSLKLDGVVIERETEILAQVLLQEGRGRGSNENARVEPLNTGHIGVDHFVHYREIVLFWRQKSVACIYICRLVHWESVLYTEVPFIQSVLYQRFHCTYS